MNEQELRSLVREAIERHLGRPQSATKVAHYDGSDIGRARYSTPETTHSSHVLLRVAPGSELDDGACDIEPAVRCNHCGFCQSYGH